MAFDFIDNPHEWEDFICCLFVADSEARRSAVRQFEPVSAARKGDFGVDGFSRRTGTVYQMYFPRHEKGTSFSTAVSRKLLNTCNKLKKNASRIESLIGGPTKLVRLVIPENPDVDILTYVTTLNHSQRFKFRIQVWGESRISNFLGQYPYIERGFRRPRHGPAASGHSETWDIALKLGPELGRSRWQAFNNALQKCDEYREILGQHSVPREFAESELFDIAGLICLSAPQMIRKCKSVERLELLKRAIEWIEQKRTTYNKKQRSVIFAARLAVCLNDIDWIGNSGRLKIWLDQAKRGNRPSPMIGDHWLVALAIMSGYDDVANSLAKTNLSRSTGRELSPDDLKDWEHAVLNVAEGLRAYAVAAWELRRTDQILPVRLQLGLKWIDFGYFRRLSPKKPHNELRLLLVYSDLVILRKVYKALRPTDEVARRLDRLTNEALTHITNDAIRSVSKKLRGAANAKSPAWHLETTYLHNQEDWVAVKKLRAFREALFGLYEAMVRERDEYLGEGWRSWTQNFQVFGLTSDSARIRELASEACGKPVPARSAP